MLELAREVLVFALLWIGVFFYLSGAVGLVRFPDVYNRLHASTKSGAIGATSILLGGIILFGLDPIGLKAVAIIVFLMLTFPVAGHLLARAAYLTGVPLTERTLHDEYKHVLTLPAVEGEQPLELVQTED